MNFIEVLMAASGAIGLGYGISVILKQQIELYRRRRGTFQKFEGKAAQILGAGIAVAGLGAMSLGVIGIQPVTMVFGIFCSALYFLSLYVADRADSTTDFVVPSKHDDQNNK